MKLDYYSALDLGPEAERGEIEESCQMALDNYAPDSVATYGLLTDEERRAALRFFQEARRVLCDDRLRSGYDEELRKTGRYPRSKRRSAVLPLRPLPEPTAVSEPLADPAAAIEPLVFPAAAGDVDSTFTSPPLQESIAPVTGLPPTPPDAPAPRPVQAESSVPSAPPVRGSAPLPTLHNPSTATAQRSASFKPPEQVLAADIPALDGRPIGGAELRAIREAKGLSLQEVAARSKISIGTLRWIEDSSFSFLPAAVYLKGFLRIYAGILKIDGNKLVLDYMRNVDAFQKE